MSEPSSRRSFLFGRQATADDRWSKFVVTLRRNCRGSVKLVAEHQAYLEPLQLDDVIQARVLCHQHQVVLALAGLPLAARDQARPVLWVQAGSAWGSLIPLGDTGLWRVDAGCPLAVTQAAGLLSADWPAHMSNVAQWFALAYRGQPLAMTALSDHLVSVDWMLPDGTIEVFGAFGTRDSQPLSSLAAQKCVPRLFELAMQRQWQASFDADQWPWRLHLDALMNPDAVNLAHVFVGHGGALGWLVAATFRQNDEPLKPVRTLTPKMVTSPPNLPEAGRLDLDQSIKGIVDPDQVFLSLAEQTE